MRAINLKALRQAVWMVLMWPLKASRNQSFARIAHREVRHEAVSFRSFVVFGALRLLFFLLVPVAFVVEWWGQSNSYGKACPSGTGPDGWCDANVVDGVADMRVAACQDDNDASLDYLIEFCLSCHHSSHSQRKMDALNGCGARS